MKTLRLFVDPANLDSEMSQSSLQMAASILRDGGTVAFPTETVYGLGANAFDEGAVSKIFLAKQRPQWDPLIVHVIGVAMLNEVATSVPHAGAVLAQAFWPGPLTLLLPRAEAIPPVVTAGRERVGVRIPSHPVAQALIDMAGLPLAAPSANSFGHTSPTTAQHVLDDLDGRIDAVIDSGETIHGIESTVVDVCEDNPIIYRPGIITREQIECLCPGTVVFRAPTNETEPEALPSPGVGLRHYAPRARVLLIGGDGAEQREAFAAAVESALESKERVGLMLPDEFSTANGVAEIYRWGRWKSEVELAQRLFAGLRFLDDADVSLILCPLPAGKGVGAAIRDRLEKAAK